MVEVVGDHKCDQMKSVFTLWVVDLTLLTSKYKYMDPLLWNLEWPKFQKQTQSLISHHTEWNTESIIPTAKWSHRPGQMAISPEVFLQLQVSPPSGH